jgi:hypothetical protein
MNTMKSEYEKSMRAISLAAIVIGTFQTACFEKKKKDNPIVVVDPANAKNPDGDGDKAPGEGENKPENDQVSTALNTESLTFLETQIDLLGDFRVKKVERDSTGNYYAAFVSDVRETAVSSAVPGYALIKFDAAGKELWRFPTLATVENAPISNSRIGSYMRGALSDMQVTADGRIFLIGLAQYAQDLPNPPADRPAPAGTIANLNSARGWPRAERQLPDLSILTRRLVNVTFLKQLLGGGITANSPSVISQTVLATPVWWTPTAVHMDSDGAVSIESASGLVQNVGVVQQIQRIDANFSKVLESVCFVSQNIHASSGKYRLVNLATAASASAVERMSAPVILTYSDVDASTDPEAFRTAILTHENTRENGRCWDLIGSRVMPADDTNFKIIKPSILVDGQAMTSKVASLSDLLPSGKNSFEEYGITTKGVEGSPSWTPLYFESQAKSSELSSARWFALGSELIHLGLDTEDLFGNHLLVVGNGRMNAEKSWRVALRSSSERSPGSLDLVSIGNGQHLAIAWTDVHLPGESNAENRGLRIAQLPIGSLTQDQAQLFQFEVPASTGHSSFSSVRLADAGNGGLAVFATVGTREANSSAELAVMKQATLLIGFTK